MITYCIVVYVVSALVSLVTSWFKLAWLRKTTGESGFGLYSAWIVPALIPVLNTVFAVTGSYRLVKHWGVYAAARAK